MQCLRKRVESKQMVKRCHWGGLGQHCRKQSSPWASELSSRSFQHPNSDSCSLRVCKGPRAKAKLWATVIYTLEIVSFCWQCWQQFFLMLKIWVVRMLVVEKAAWEEPSQVSGEVTSLVNITPFCSTTVFINYKVISPTFSALIPTTALWRIQSHLWMKKLGLKEVRWLAWGQRTEKGEGDF